MKSVFSKEKLWFVAMFAVIGFIALQIPLTQLVGAKVKFTLFDAFAPVAGAFIGSVPGVIAVVLMQVANHITHGFDKVAFDNILTFLATVRVIPTLFAVWYFAQKGRFNWLVPLLAMIAFWAHPVGRAAAPFALLWTIPILMFALRDRFLVARSLGATFCAHAVGGALWVWTFGLTKEIWLGLIPVALMERALFAVGIAVAYIVVNNVLAILHVRELFPTGVRIDKKYLWSGAR